jgi:hypothetical protein
MTEIMLLALSAVLIPWMGWCSVQLLQIQVRLARGEENFDRVNGIMQDHEQRIRALEAHHRPMS